MKHSKLYTHLGIAGALLIPAFAVAAVDIPNVFEGGDPVSASEMNENFEVMANAIEALEAKVETLESAGLQPPVELSRYTAPVEDIVVIYQVHTDGVMTASVRNLGSQSTEVRLDFGTTEKDALDCNSSESGCTVVMGRGFDGDTSSVLVPAGQYVAIRIDELLEVGLVKVLWQPLRGPDPLGSEPTLVASSHP